MKMENEEKVFNAKFMFFHPHSLAFHGRKRKFNDSLVHATTSMHRQTTEKLNLLFASGVT